MFEVMTRSSAARHNDFPPLSLRPLGPGDEILLQRFFQTHTAETILMRYGYAVKEMTPARARELVNVNLQRDAVWAFLIDHPGQPSEIVAVGRFFGDPKGQGAEFALVVAESMRRRGLGRKLLTRLKKSARELGFNHLWGSVRPDNHPMRRLMEKAGAHPATDADGMLRYRLDISR